MKIEFTSFSEREKTFYVAMSFITLAVLIGRIIIYGLFKR